IKLQDKRHHLIEKPQKFALKPDIVMNKDDKVIRIADTKWKIIHEDKDINQADLYQMYAYGKKYNINQLYLIYPKDGENQTKFKFKYDDNLRLKVCYFDLER
ncbi:MAG: restriction endonuclease, partial [Campylobacterales bacterium]|nr:restriction endonuclease [Campylobacterales bacterium]